MRPQSLSCGLSCNGKLGSNISRHAILTTLLSDGFRNAQSIRMKEFYDNNPEKTTRLFGKDNPAWKHGEASRGYTNFTESLKSTVRARDNNTCQTCGYKWDNVEPRLDVHHIDGDKDNFAPDNLVTWCKKCHTSFHRRQGSVEMQN